MTSKIDLIILVLLSFGLGIVLTTTILKVAGYNKPETPIEINEVPKQEVVIDFVLRNPQEGQFAIRYEVFHNDQRIGSVHTSPLTPGIYTLEVE